MSKLPPIEEIEEQLRTQLSELLGDSARVRRFKSDDSRERAKFQVQVGNEGALTGIVRSRGDAATVASVIEQIDRNEILDNEASLLVVPYMGEVGAELCREAGIHWADLSGNAHITFGKVYVHVRGNPNDFKSRGRPSNVFAPKSSRISRFLLQHPNSSFSQRELAYFTNLSDGYTSKIVHRLEDKNLIVRHNDGSVSVRNPDLMLDAWRERYDFDKHRVIRGTVSARNTGELLDKLTEGLDALGGTYAATGLAAAWLMTKFASHRITTFYVEQSPPETWKRELRLHEEPRGANTWLVVPTDRGVFQGQEPVGGVSCVHPIQVYLDLEGHPERSDEAADSIRRKCMPWSEND
mgnify:CR=1 FL=1